MPDWEPKTEPDKYQADRHKTITGFYLFIFPGGIETTAEALKKIDLICKCISS